VKRYVEIRQKIRKAMKFVHTLPPKVVDLETLEGRRLHEDYLEKVQIENAQYGALFKAQLELLPPIERYFHDVYQKRSCSKHPLPTFEA
jgi:hypothetical protein